MEWTPANDGCGARNYFLIRDDESVPLDERYHCDKRGWLIRYKSYNTARRAANRLNIIGG